MQDDASGLSTLVSAYPGEDATKLCTPCSYAMSLEHHASVRVLLRHILDSLCASEHAEPLRRLLCAAASMGFSEYVTALADKPVSLNAYDRGMTALLHAAREGHLEVARLLISRGASLRSTDERGWTPLFHAVDGQHEDLVDELVDAGSPVNEGDPRSLITPLILASQINLPRSIRKLISAGANLCAADFRGCTSLMFAAIHGHDDALSELLAAGADPNATDDCNWTALAFASLHGKSVGAVQLLLSRAASPWAVEGRSRTPLQLAESRGHTEIAALLQRTMDSHRLLALFKLPASSSLRSSPLFDVNIFVEIASCFKGFRTPFLT